MPRHKHADPVLNRFSGGFRYTSCVGTAYTIPVVYVEAVGALHAHSCMTRTSQPTSIHQVACRQAELSCKARGRCGVWPTAEPVRCACLAMRKNVTVVTASVKMSTETAVAM